MKNFTYAFVLICYGASTGLVYLILEKLIVTVPLVVPSFEEWLLLLFISVMIMQISINILWNHGGRKNE